MSSREQWPQCWVEGLLQREQAYFRVNKPQCIIGTFVLPDCFVKNMLPKPFFKKNLTASFEVPFFFFNFKEVYHPLISSHLFFELWTPMSGGRGPLVFVFPRYDSFRVHSAGLLRALQWNLISRSPLFGSKKLNVFLDRLPAPSSEIIDLASFVHV